MLWREKTNLKLLSYLKKHIDMEVTGGVDQNQWRITSFYREPNTNRRNELWDLLRQLSQQFNKPGLCMGDFNKILWNHQKLGECLRRESQMVGFKEALADSEIEDLGFTSPWFSWEKVIR
ncbi:hypothetical protein REPUB_Repub06bG0103700 [Reevesia pubescens]